jgi:hypothetical protein
LISSRNTVPECRVLTVGEESTSVLIIDDLVADVKSIYDHARNRCQFSQESGTYYPGVRAPLPGGYSSTLRSIADQYIRQHYEIGGGLEAVSCAALFSIVTMPEEHLAPLQRIPHFDRHEQNIYAVMHYLSPGQFGGTGFFRHKPTGFERIDDSRRAEYLSAVSRFFDEHGQPPATYIRTTTNQYELIGSVDYKPNRLVIYPGNLLHSGLIDPAADIYRGKGLARLTCNILLNYE